MDQTATPKFHSPTWRAGNAMVSVLARIGVGPIDLLTTRGRRTGRAHVVPVVPIRDDGRLWLVAPYGPVAWVHNVRADHRVTLRHGRTSHEYTAREVGAAEAGPVLKRYVAVATKTRPLFDATEASPVAAFVTEADRHPVFELTPSPGV